MVYQCLDSIVASKEKSEFGRNAILESRDINPAMTENFGDWILVKKDKRRGYRLNYRKSSNDASQTLRRENADVNGQSGSRFEALLIDVNANLFSLYPFMQCYGQDL